MNRVYLLYHGLDHGHGEDCSIFHENPEVFLDESLFENRKQEVKNLQRQASLRGWTGFYMHELVLNIGNKVKPRNIGEEYSDEEV